MKICKWYELHKWRNIYQVNSRKFLNDTYNTYISNLKICTKCGLVREYHYDSQGGYWSNLREAEREILSKYIIEKGNRLIIDKGN